MIHEYIEDLTVLADAVQASYLHLDFVISVAEAIIQDLVQREII